MAMVDDGYILSEKDIPFLVETLAPVRDKWIMLAVDLGLPSHVIEKCRSVQIVISLFKVLHAWIQGNGDKRITLEQLKKCLESNLVGHRMLAEHLIPKFNHVKEQDVTESHKGSSMDINKKVVLEILYPARERWYKIGILLAVDINRLESLMNLDSVDEKLEAVIDYWFYNSTNKSWRKLANVMGSKIVNRCDIMDRIMESLIEFHRGGDEFKLPVQRNPEEDLNIKNIHIKLYPARKKWFFIGLALKIDSDVLNEIEMDYHSDDERLQAVIDHWLCNSPNKSWMKLAKCMESEIVDEHDIKKGIMEMIKRKKLTEDSEKIAALIKEEENIERKTAHIMIIGYPGTGKSLLLANLLDQLREPRDSNPSTGISDSVIIVDVAGKDISSHTSVIGSSWKKFDSFEDSMHMQLQQCDKLAMHDEKQLPQLEEQVSLDEMPLLATKSEPTASLQENTKTKTVLERSLATKSEPTASLQDNIFTVLKDSKMSYEDLESSFSLYIRDTGGQVEFQEVLSILINGPSIFFFVIKANLSLDQPLTFEYRKGEEVINRYKSTTTTRQALVQTLTTIQNTAKPTDIATHDSVVFIIGTHTDKIEPPESKEEYIRKLNAELHNFIESHEFNLIVYKDKKSNSVLFPVSNTNREPKDFQLIRDRVNKKIEGTNAFKIPYPLGYLLFSLELRHCKDDVVKRTKCEEIAENFLITGDKEVTKMLNTLHHRMGIIKYYETDDLKHLVIKEPQVLFNKLTELIVKTFPSSEALLPSTEKNLIKGIIKASELKQLFTEASAMKPKEFISFLEHLRIAASFHEEGEKYFFIPSVINHLSEKNLGQEAKSKVCPLAITFKCSYCPKGVFGMSVCHFMSKEEKEDHITFSLEKESIYKDLVCLKVYSSDEPKGKVFVKIQSSIEQPPSQTSPKPHPSRPFTSSHIEVRFCPNEDKDFITLAPLCNQIRTTLMDGIQRSLTQLNYSESRVGAAESLECPSCQQLHKKVTNNGKVSVDCNNIIYAVNDSCSCWFSDGMKKPASARVVEDSETDIQQSNTAAASRSAIRQSRRRVATTATASSSTIRQSQRRTAKTTARRSQKKADKRKRPGYRFIKSSSSKRLYQCEVPHVDINNEDDALPPSKQQRLASSTLTDNDLGDVYEVMFNANTKWYEIGLQLKVDLAILEAINEEEKENSKKLLRMLKHWLQTGTNRSWEALDKALRNKTVARSDVADKLNVTFTNY